MIAVVGGSGFIGSRLCRRLEQAGREFFIVDKAESPWYAQRTRIADVREPKALEEALGGASLIINLSAEHADNVTPRSLYYRVNVDGARNVCDAAERLAIPSIIFTSTVAVYGFAEPDADETAPIRPFNDYGRSKHQAEQIYREWQTRGPDRALTIVRPTVVFGERNRGNVYNLLRQIASGRFAMIGPGTNLKSMAYVENVAAFLEHALSFGPGVRVYNYVDKPDLDMNRLVETVFAEMGLSGSPRRIPYWLGWLGGLGFDMLAFVTRKKFPISRIRVKKFCATTQFASERKSETGFTPPVPPAEAIRRTVRWEFLEESSDELTFESE